MTAVALYWAQGCHLCEPAKVTARAVVRRARRVAGGDRHHRRRDARGRRTAQSLPVLEIDGRRAFKFFVDEHDLRERLAPLAGSLTAPSAPHNLGLLCAADALRYRRVYPALCCYEIVGITGAKPLWHPSD